MTKTILTLAFLLLTLTGKADNVTFTSSNLPIVIIQTQQAINADEKLVRSMDRIR